MGTDGVQAFLHRATGSCCFPIMYGLCNSNQLIFIMMGSQSMKWVVVNTNIASCWMLSSAEKQLLLTWKGTPGSAPSFAKHHY